LVPSSFALLCDRLFCSVASWGAMYLLSPRKRRESETNKKIAGSGA